jgi:small conductance mechanosensitive channel
MTADFLTVRTDITRRIKEEFDAAGISIPFPQRDIHLYSVPEK